MNSFPLAGLDGYKSKTLSFKSTRDGDINVDVAYPELPGDVESSTVLLHYHGGFLAKTTAQSSLEDAVDAYEWVLSSLPQILDRKIGSVLLAGSSAGGYLALATAATVKKQPSALLLIYGMLDATFPRYTTPGANIFGKPLIDTTSILADLPIAKENDTRPVLSAYPMDPANPIEDPRLTLASALHIDAIYLDYMTGIEGLGRDIAKQGVEAIPQQHRNLFPLAFGDLKKLPRTLLLHGKNDSAVPVEPSIQAAEKLRVAGVQVSTEFPEDGEHGFDVRVGDVDVEKSTGENVPNFQSLRNAINFLQSAVERT
ncbi:hypothetical protein G7Z17_g2458 [Cylindrodendrum hubeiense]|uniref:Alpha/beta hydrolase fold-3 domain-containing protein n=1 Tax=Cylindrodendrum hubeiense TaxID=595255 RepID=A0A9P5HHS5_9HYPO|nr:hypothetical protein G7Z17_g2458 [Cylindrodendrum hubeiense]